VTNKDVSLNLCYGIPTWPGAMDPLRPHRSNLQWPSYLTASNNKNKNNNKTKKKENEQTNRSISNFSASEKGAVNIGS